MKRRSTLALLAILLFSCAQHAAAQAQSADAAASQRAEAEKSAELEKKAVALLREAVSDSQGLRLVENRVRPQTAAAGLLWTRDEQAARALFKGAADAVAAYGASLDPEDPQFYNAAQSVSQMRAELVQAVAQFDPKLALEYLRSTRLPNADALRASGYATDAQEQQLEMSLAARVATQDPAMALRMAEQSLSKGITMSLVSVLQELETKDPAAASKLATEIVKRLRAEDLTNNYDASAIASQLLTVAQQQRQQLQQSSQLPPTNIVIDGPMAVAPIRTAAAGAAPLVDEQTRAALVEKILAAAMSDTPNQSGAYNLNQSLQLLLPEIEKTTPARAEAIRRRANTLERSVNPQADAWRPYRQIAETGNVDALLEAAPKAPPEIREQLYTQAVWKAFNDGDVERARQLIENIQNPQQRGQMRRNIETQLQWREAQQGNYAEARAAAARLTLPDEKLTALMQIASVAFSKGDAQAARQALDDARLVASAEASGPQQFRAQLQVAQAYAPLDSGQSFEMVESAIARLNELLDAAATLEGFGQDMFKDGELRPQYGYVWGELVGQCAGTLAALAPKDFDRASADAKSFRRMDVRAAAELQLAQGLLMALPRVGLPIQGRGRNLISISGARYRKIEE
jgi:hypothetical protein